MSICGECQRPIGTCSWNREFKPVPGWTATPTRILMYTTMKGTSQPGYVDSYNVTDCPLYIPPKRQGRQSEYRKSSTFIAENIETHEKTRYASVREACEAGGFVPNGVRETLDGHKQSHHGYLFYYEEETP